MKRNLNRRQFMRTAFSGIAATSLLTSGEKSRLFASVESLPNGNDEQFWRSVQAQFRLRPDLTYLNNASLGASPDIVIDANDKYRRMLDGFPSKYMWEDWWDEKQVVREKAV